jgi:hypothetical protein
MADELDYVSVAARDGVYIIDLTYRVAPVVDLVLSQTACGGFVFHAQKYGEWYYSNAEGRVNLTGPHYSLTESDRPSEPFAKTLGRMARHEV